MKVSSKYMRRLAGFRTGETMVKCTEKEFNRMMKSADKTNDMFKFCLNGYAKFVKGNGIVLTDTGHEKLVPYEKTTCMFTGRKVIGEF